MSILAFARSTPIYVEIPAPFVSLNALLRSPHAWPRQLADARRGAEYWEWQNDLYQLQWQDSTQLAPDRVQLRFTITRLGAPEAKLFTVELRDAGISCHAAISGPAVQGANRRALQAQITTIAAQLGAAARQQQAQRTAHYAHHASPNGYHPAEAALEQHPLAEELAARYPQTVAAFVEMGALDHLERVYRLEQGWEQIMAGRYDPDCYQLDSGSAPTTQPDYDLIYAGSGLGLLHAALMARRHRQRVLVFDRGIVGCAHREWNISRDELQTLLDLGLMSAAELESVVMREYRDGLVRFFDSPQSDVPASELRLPTVLNVALDANALLQLARRLFEAAGGTVLSERAFRRVRTFAEGRSFVEVEVERLHDGGREHYTARLLLDGMGSTSPLALYRFRGAPFAGVCPTVGTVAHGFVRGDAPDEHNPDVGDILISVADAQRGEQMMWEGFPGRGDELTIYLFYYATVRAAGHPDFQPTERHSLLQLFEDYFTLLPTYKRPGPHFAHLKPVYGYIPARHSLARQEAPLLKGVLPVGDSAAQQSPLTFCGFGSHVRNLGRTCDLLAFSLYHELLSPEQLHYVSAFQSNVSLNWVFSRFMHPWSAPHDVNRLQNLFLRSLNELGADHATRFFRDQMRWRDYHPMLFGVLRRWPVILPLSWRVLGGAGVAQWASDYLRFSYDAARASIARLGGRLLEQGLTRAAGWFGHEQQLRVQARYAEWRAMGWM